MTSNLHATVRSIRFFMPFRSYQLIRELDITGGNDAAVGYYAGVIVGVDIMTCVNCYSNCRI
jgi:hypothetical protein